MHAIKFGQPNYSGPTLCFLTSNGVADGFKDKDANVNDHVSSQGIHTEIKVHSTLQIIRANAASFADFMAMGMILTNNQINIKKSQR